MKKISTIALISLLFAYGAQAAQRLNLSIAPLAIKNINTTKDANRTLKQQFNLNNDYAFTFKSRNTDLKGNRHTRYQQQYKGVDVWAQQAITHHSRKTSATHLSGQIISHIEKDLHGNVVPDFSKDQIISLIKDRASSKLGELSNYRRELADLIIYFDTHFNKAHLAYSVEILANKKSGGVVRHMFIVDAKSGFIYQNWNALMHIDVTGPGGNTKTGRYNYGTDYAALNASDDGNGTCFLENTNVRAVDLNHAWSNDSITPYQFNCPENTYKEINGAYSPINDAFFFGNLAFDMFNDWYNASPLPTQLLMKVHYGHSYSNAFWDGEAMTFGDGGNDFFPLVDVNVSVHEVSHGFTDFNSDLIYSNESGGMNEAFSDIAGEAAEYYWKQSVDWFIGGDIMKNEDGLRFFEDPSQDGRSIGHYDDYYNGMDVHFSSGIYNRAYFLLSNTEGWNPKTAFDIFVLANQSYWLPNETFASGACGLIAAARDLQYEWKDIYNALLTVGVICSGNTIDDDQDGVSDIAELIYGFNPNDASDGLADFDGDGLSNRVEIMNAYDPKDRDTDNDGLSDTEEQNLYGTMVNHSDSDSDGMDDGWEVQHSFNPNNDADAVQDLDGDGRTNLQEFQDGTDPADNTDVKITVPPSSYDIEDQALMAGAQMYTLADASFVASNAYASSGTYSLASEDISDYQSAGIEWSIESLEGFLTFDLKTSTEAGWDFFLLYLDNQIVFSRSGEHDWETIDVPITEGQHDVIFVYWKDSIISAGEDTVWIDNINYSGLKIDNDGDAMSDSWETHYGLDPSDPTDAQLDSDDDGLLNLAEHEAETNPMEADSDGDSLTDSEELNTYNTDPNNVDTDHDSLDDALEISLGLDPLDASDVLLDLDNDGISNHYEFQFGSDLNDANSIPNLLGHLSNEFGEPLSEHWSSPSNESWEIATDAEHTQLKTEPLSNNKQARIDYINVFEAGTLRFDLSYDTEEAQDEVQILLDNEVIHTFSGQSASTAVEINLERGGHVISLVYNKDIAASTVSDFAAIDNLEFIAPLADSDDDGINNADELALGTDLMNPDSDDDGLLDGAERAAGLNPLSQDSDGDGLPDNLDPLPLDSERWSKSTGGGGMLNLLIVLLSLIFLHNTRKP